MPIGEFIDDVTPIELQKFEVRNPITRLIGGGDNKSKLDESQMLNLTMDNVSAKKAMKRLDSKASVRTSATKTTTK